MAYLDILVPCSNYRQDWVVQFLNSINSQQQIDMSSITVTFINKSDDPGFIDQSLIRRFPFSIKYAKHEQTEMAAIKNSLISDSNSDYFLFCDQNSYFSDDLALYNIINTLLAHTPDILVTNVKHQFFNPKTNALENIISPSSPNKITSTTTAGKIFKRAFILKNNLKFLPCFGTTEDYYFTSLALQLATNVRFTPMIASLVFYESDMFNKAAALAENTLRPEIFLEIIKSNYFIVQELLNRKLFTAAQFTIEQLLYEAYIKFATTKNFTREIISPDLLWEIKLALYSYYLAYHNYIGAFTGTLLNKLYSCAGVFPSTVHTWIVKLVDTIKVELGLVRQSSFSIIIPTHNRSGSLTKAVDSVLAQDYTNYEIIIVDDISSDNTRSVVNQKYAAEIKAGKIKYFLNTTKYHGAAGARNFGLQKAKNEWIAYLDDDNTWFSNFLTVFNAAINKHPTTKCFYARWINQVFKSVFFYFNKDTFNFDFLNRQNFIDMGVFVHHRQLIKELGGFNSNLKSLEDWDLILKYTHKYTPVALDFIVLSYYDNPTASRITTAAQHDYTQSIATIPSYCKEDAPSVTALLLTYNHKEFIEEALKSALIQRGNFKYSIVIADDGSTDGTAEIINKYANQYPNLITVLTPGDHVGLNENYRRAIASISSDYVAVLEGDDFWTGWGARIENLLKHFDESEDIQFVFNRANLFQYTPTIKKIYGYTNVTINKHILDINDLYGYPEFNFIINWSSVIFRTAALKSIPDCIYTDYPFSEIPVQLYLLQNNGKAYFDFTPLTTYRIHSAGVWSGADETHKQLMIYQNRRSAYNIALPEGKKILYKLIHPLAARLAQNQTIEPAELESLEADYAALVSPVQAPIVAASSESEISSPKGIILAGGSGTRLYPLTLGTCKPLLPVYDKPMIYYPLSLLLLAGIREILIISTPDDLPTIKKLLGDGERFGIRLAYEVQPEPKGIAEAFIIGKDFIGNSPCVLALGDNIFYGAGLIEKLQEANNNALNGKATIFGYQVNDPERFGIVELDSNNRALSIEEKPKKPKSNYCVTGLYFYPTGVTELVNKLKPSKRGELEITDLNKLYLNNNNLFVQLLGRGYSWMDVGTHDSLLDASNYIKLIQEHQRLKICCPEEIAFNNNWIDASLLAELGEKMHNNDYGKYLTQISKKDDK